MNLSKRKLAIIALILANVIWGAALPVYKWALESIPPFTFAFLRFFIASLILVPFVYRKLKFNTKDLPRLIFGALVSVTFQIPLLFLGLTLSKSINAPIIISSGPIILIGTSFIFLKEKVSKKLFAGTLISLMGVLALIVGPSFTQGFGKAALGDFFIFIATVCGVIQAIVFKKLLQRNEVLPVLFLTFLLGSLTLIPASFIEIKDFGMFALNLQSISGLLYAILLSSIVGYYCLIYGLRYINTSEIGVFSYVDPIATILIALPLLHEVITESYVLAVVLVFGGIFVAEGRLHYHPLHKLFR